MKNHLEIKAVYLAAFKSNLRNLRMTPAPHKYSIEAKKKTPAAQRPPGFRIIGVSGYPYGWALCAGTSRSAAANDGNFCASNFRRITSKAVSICGSSLGRLFSSG